MIIRVDDNRGIFLCGLTPEQCKQLRLSILAARECSYKGLSELANDLRIRVRSFPEEMDPETGIIDKYYHDIQLNWEEITFLMVVMVNQATNRVTRDSARSIYEITEGLTCAMDMGLVK